MAPTIDRAPAGAARAALGVGVWVALASCAPLQSLVGPRGAPAAPDPARCQALDDRASYAAAAAIVGGALGGATGLGSLPVETGAPRTALVLGSVVATAIAAGAAALEHEASSSYVAEGCGNPLAFPATSSKDVREENVRTSP